MYLNKITLIGFVTLGRHWWPPYLIIAIVVVNVLLLAPDPYIAIGILVGLFPFALLCLMFAVGVRQHRPAAR